MASLQPDGQRLGAEPLLREDLSRAGRRHQPPRQAMSVARDPVAEPGLADLAVFRPVKAGNTFEETVERLAQAVKLGVVPKGGRLPAERELAERLNVSRVTLREAIKALQQAGFVVSRRGRTGGTFV